MKRNIIPFVILIIALLLVYYSCGRNENNDIKILKLPESGEDMLKISSFADTVVYIPLETTEISLIDNIKSLWMNDSVIIIQCRDKLLMFNINGKFIRQIGKKGLGPGEYKRLNSFVVVRDTVYISTGDEFLRYTFNNTYCDEIRPGGFPLECSSTTVDQKLAIYNYTDGKVYVYNNRIPDTIIVEHGVETRLRYIYGVYVDKLFSYFQKTSSGLLFSNYLNDTVWNITGDKKEPAFILDTKYKLLPWDKQAENYTMANKLEYIEQAKNYYFFNLVPVSSNMLIFQNPWIDDKYFDNIYFHQAVYYVDAKTNDIKRFESIYDDIAGKQAITWIYHTYSDNYLVGEISPFSLLKVRGNKSIDSPSPAWINQTQTIKEDDNPIIILIKVKKDMQ